MNKKKRAEVIFVFVIVLIIVVGSALYFKYNPLTDNSINPAVKDYCSQDSDCVPSSCCHPNECTLKINEPNCSGIACTMNCQPGTLDCGFANCACRNNKCGVVKSSGQ